MSHLGKIIILLLFGAVCSRGQTNFTVMTIRTGVDESTTNSLITYGLPDTNWVLYAVSGNTNPGLLPRDAIVVNREAGWNSGTPISGTRVISIGTNYGGADNQYLAPEGFYTFRYTFFVDLLSLSNWTVSGSVWADDSVEVRLNGNTVLSTGVIWNQPPVSFTNNNQSFWLNGTNTIDFIVHNTGGTPTVPLPTGLSASLLVTAVPEPKSAALAAIGLAGIVWNLRRSRSRH
jgi:hypothetical protein